MYARKVGCYRTVNKPLAPTSTTVTATACAWSPTGEGVTLHLTHWQTSSIEYHVNVSGKSGCIYCANVVRIQIVTSVYSQKLLDDEWNGTTKSERICSWFESAGYSDTLITALLRPTITASLLLLLPLLLIIVIS